jgi:uncharacterized protein (TIGR02145 family)
MKPLYAVITYLSFLMVYMPSTEAQTLTTDGTRVVEVTSKTGRIWMDRNLGASQVATSSTNAASFGYLYQWGRPSDGHQFRNSANSSTLSSQEIPKTGLFILALKNSNDWYTGQSDQLWQGLNGKNNPCPKGFRLPTSVELEAEIATWSSKNAKGAFASPLKLPMSGYRSNGNGSITDAGLSGDYWTSTRDGLNSRGLYFDVSSAGTDAGGRACGVSVRCIKD